MSVAQQSPAEAWQSLVEEDAALVDVRTRPEWAFVGLADLSPAGKRTLMLEWRKFPDMSVNDSFAETLAAEFGDSLPSKIFFICRSGARSLEAASTAAMHFAANGKDVACINVAEGFEGDLDADGHRGLSNGWKARGLPWRQS